MTAPQPTPCPGCPAAEERAHAMPSTWVRCESCGSEFRVERPARRVPKPFPDIRAGDQGERQVRAYVAAVLAWDASVARVERAARGGGISSILVVIRAGELGILGDGCSGTRGTGRAPEPDRDVSAADPEGTRRYRALRSEARVVTDAVIADGQGDQVRDVVVAERELPLSLAQRVGYALASGEQRAAWERCVALRDSAPALAGMSERGAGLLERAAREWHGS
jgi:hypothetical protein